VLAVPTAAEQPARILAGMVVADARRAGVALEDFVISTATASPPFVAMSRPNARLTQADTAEAAATVATCRPVRGTARRPAPAQR
jgi:hypothetical protein